MVWHLARMWRKNVSGKTSLTMVIWKTNEMVGGWNWLRIVSSSGLSYQQWWTFGFCYLRVSLWFVKKKLSKEKYLKTGHI